MAFFVIVGRTNCKKCTHAVYVADFLSKQLPHFKYCLNLKPDSEWPSWLDQCNSINNWHQTKSPVIWKEVSRMGGQKYLIGGLGEFWEYCYDYYGFESKLSNTDLERIMTDNLQMEQHRKEPPKHRFCLVGASDLKMLEMMVYELQTCVHLKKGEQMEIKIYDELINSDPDAEAHLLDIVDDLKPCIQFTPQSLRVVLTAEDAIAKSDYLIILSNYSSKFETLAPSNEIFRGYYFLSCLCAIVNSRYFLILSNYNRLQSEDLDSWLERCRQNMLYLADDINLYGKRNIRLILSHPGPTCFTASVLMEYCTRIRPCNIVAVTADAGISVISWMAEKIGEPVRNFWCPPVWGFPGLIEFINLPRTAIQAKVYRPFKRALLTKETTKLPKGVIQYEMRFFENYIKVDDELFEECARKKADTEMLLQRQSFLPKVRALGSLLKLWSSEEISDDIISLGICSNGSFGFQPGICFSQAVRLNEKRIWRPASCVPLTTTTVARIAAISLQVEGTLSKFGLGTGQKLESNYSSTAVV